MKLWYIINLKRNGRYSRDLIEYDVSRTKTARNLLKDDLWVIFILIDDNEIQ